MKWLWHIYHIRHDTNADNVSMKRMRKFHCQYQGLCYRLLSKVIKITRVFPFHMWRKKSGRKISGIFSIVMVALREFTSLMLIKLYFVGFFIVFILVVQLSSSCSFFFFSSNVLLLTFVHKTFLHNIKLNDFCCASFFAWDVWSLRHHPEISFR